MRRFFRTLAWSIVFILGLTACAGPAQPPAPSGAGAGQAAATGPKRIVVAIRGDPLHLSSRIGGAGAGSVPGVDEVEHLINAGLVLTDHEGTYHPQLAMEVPTTENGLWKVLPDGRMEITWNLKEGIKWHDGAPFTSADLVFTARVEQDDDLEVIRNVAYRSVEAVEAPDPLTVRVLWKRPFIRADRMFNAGQRGFALPMPKHILEDAYLNQKETFLDLPFWTSQYLGTGAYRLDEFVPGVRAVLVKNPDYVLGPPKIDEIEVKFIPDPSTLGANILAGEVDLTLGGRLSLDWGTQVRDLWQNGRMFTPPPGNQISAWPQLLTPSPAVIGNVEFRRALMHAVNRQQMIDALLEGLSPVADSVVSPLDPEYKAVEQSIVRYAYDPNRAGQLIAGLGFAKGPDGMFRGPDGPLRVELRARANDEMQVKALLAVADNWERAGVGVEQVHFPPQRASDREFRATRPGFEVVRQPAGVDSFDRYHSSSTPLPENRFSGRNRTRYQHSELDRLIDGFLTAIPMRERLGYAARIVQHMTDQVLILTLFYDVTPAMISNRLINVAGPGAVWDAHLWDVKQG